MLRFDWSGVRDDRGALERGIGGVRRRMVLAAALEQRPGLTQMLALWDRADERQALRLRGIRYVVTLGGQTLELTA